MSLYEHRTPGFYYLEPGGMQVRALDGDEVICYVVEPYRPELSKQDKIMRRTANGRTLASAPRLMEENRVLNDTLKGIRAKMADMDGEFAAQIVKQIDETLVTVTYGLNDDSGGRLHHLDGWTSPDWRLSGPVPFIEAPGPYEITELEQEDDHDETSGIED